MNITYDKLTLILNANLWNSSGVNSLVLKKYFLSNKLVMNIPTKITQEINTTARAHKVP